MCFTCLVPQSAVSRCSVRVAFNRWRTVAGMMWKFYVFRLRCRWCFSVYSQHLCLKPSALDSAVQDCPQRLQGDSSFCAACSTTLTEKGRPLLYYKKCQWVVTSSPLLMCPCYVPALPPATYFQVHAFTSQSLLVTVLVSILSQHCGTPIYISLSFLWEHGESC